MVAVIDVSDLHKSYGDVHAVDGITVTRPSLEDIYLELTRDPTDDA